MKHKKRYSKTTIADVKKNLGEKETIEQAREKFPSKLIKAFVALHKSKYAEKEYAVYIKNAKEFLEDKFNDPIECGKLIVMLTGVTYDLVKD